MLYDKTGGGDNQLVTIAKRGFLSPSWEHLPTSERRLFREPGTENLKRELRVIDDLRPRELPYLHARRYRNSSIFLHQHSGPTRHHALLQRMAAGSGPPQA